jgi:hypothetical protein
MSQKKLNQTRIAQSMVSCRLKDEDEDVLTIIGNLIVSLVSLQHIKSIRNIA